MASKNVPILAALPPWKLKGTIYTFMLYTSSKDAEILSSDPSFLYSPLEAASTFARGKLIGGLAMIQVIRYSESPIGPYDEFLMVPGAFQYDVAIEQNGKAELKMKKNARVSKIYVSQKNTCWNGRINWNIPKHLARFTFTNLPSNAIAIAVYPHDTNGSSSEATPNSNPIFSAIYKPISYLPSFPMSTSVAKYAGIDLSLVQPPLPEGKGSQGELPRTERWCQVLPREYSSRTSLGWWDLKQVDAGENEPLLGRESDRRDGREVYENFWPGIGRWRIGMKMEDATIEFPEGKYWDEPQE